MLGLLEDLQNSADGQKIPSRYKKIGEGKERGGDWVVP
jgi:hypothetical protein